MEAVDGDVFGEFLFITNPSFIFLMSVMRCISVLLCTVFLCT